MHIPSSYQDHAQEFIRLREESAIGVSTLLRWSSSLRPQSCILDLGCGSGKPIAIALAERGFTMYGVDASETLAEAYRQQVTRSIAVCEAIECSRFFERQFDAAIAIGLFFLLTETAQAQLIKRIASTLRSGGRFLFTAPTQIHQWNDILTGTESISLGRDAYLNVAEQAGFKLMNEWVDEGENHYYAFSLSSTPTEA